MGEDLQQLIDSCSRCHRLCVGNVPIIVGDSGVLTAEQIQAVYAYLVKRHKDENHDGRGSFVNFGSGTPVTLHGQNRIAAEEL